MSVRIRFAKTRAILRAVCGGAALLALSVTAAAVPSVVNYQGRLTDNTAQQNPIDATVAMEFSVWDAASGGASLWSEAQNVPVVKGLFSVLLGSTTPMPPTVFAGGAIRYLEIRVSGETLAPRQRIATAPYAGVAGSADDAQALGGASAAAYQQRIAAPCPDGYAINAVAADGTATCVQGVPGPPGPPGPGLDTGAISGTVTTCNSPAAGVLVYVPGRSVTAYSTSEGKYLLSYLPAGTYSVQYRAPGTPGSTTTGGIVVAAGQTTSQGTTVVADVMGDANNCGACGTVCSSNHVTPACASGVCAGSCVYGYGDCNGNRQADGCETDLNNAPANCGGCGATCSSNNMVPACYNGTCGGTCNAGFANCDANFRSNGCETDIMNSAANCGWCGQACAPGQSCAGGTCH